METAFGRFLTITARGMSKKQPAQKIISRVPQETQDHRGHAQAMHEPTSSSDASQPTQPLTPLVPAPGYVPPGYGMPPGYAMPPIYALPPGYGYPPGYALPPGYHPHPGAYAMMPSPYPAMPPDYPPAMQPSFRAPPPPAVPKVHATAPSPSSTPPARTPLHDPMPLSSKAEYEEQPAAVPGRFRQLWQRAGGGSLTFSILVHAALLLAAALVVVSSGMMEKSVDFLPGGGTQQGEQASRELANQVRQKQRRNVDRSVPKSRLVTASLTADVTLPDMPQDMLALPDAASLSGGGKMGSGGFGSGGAGGGFGGGMGLGGAKGFAGMTLFGKLGGEGMPGVFYDMKQTPDRLATALADLAGEAEFAGVINTAAGKKFSGKGLDQFFHSTQKMSFTYLLIPYMSAAEGPKAFQVENEVQPRAWMVHYTADVRPPAPGEYRFVGMFDDALIVYVNGRPVLDGSWYPIVDHGEKRKDEDIRQDFGGPILPGTGNRRCYAGKWVKMEGLTRIDIVVGERPGGRVGGLLLVQAKKGKYAERADGTPILPVFSLIKPTLADQARLRDYSASGFEVAEDIPVFSLTKDLFSDR